MEVESTELKDGFALVFCGTPPCQGTPSRVVLDDAGLWGATVVESGCAHLTVGRRLRRKT